MGSLVTKMAQSMGINEPFQFYKVFIEIGSLGFMKLGWAYKRTNVSE